MSLRPRERCSPHHGGSGRPPRREARDALRLRQPRHGRTASDSRWSQHLCRPRHREARTGGATHHGTAVAGLPLSAHQDRGRTPDLPRRRCRGSGAAPPLRGGGGMAVDGAVARRDQVALRRRRARPGPRCAGVASRALPPPGSLPHHHRGRRRHGSRPPRRPPRGGRRDRSAVAAPPRPRPSASRRPGGTAGRTGAVDGRGPLDPPHPAAAHAGTHRAVGRGAGAARRPRAGQLHPRGTPGGDGARRRLRGGGRRVERHRRHAPRRSVARDRVDAPRCRPLRGGPGPERPRR